MINEVVVTLISVVAEEGNGYCYTWRVKESDKLFFSKIDASSPLNGFHISGKEYLVEVKS